MLAAVVAAAVSAMPGLAPAQDLFRSLKDLGSAAASAVSSGRTAETAPSPGTAPASAASSRTTSANSPPAGALASLAPLKPNEAALNELRPDAQCHQVTEDYDIMQKAADYGGKAAQLRLQTLIESDFAQTELSASDQLLLRYLAYTTVWVPASVELAVGKAWAKLSSDGSDEPEPSGRSQRKALQRQGERMGEIRGGVEAFPGDPALVLDPKLADGAFSRVGGLVVLSPRFLAMMDEQDGVRDVLLAHELSHMYKRHALKALQYQMIGSAKGWTIARKLLRQTLAQSNARTSGSNPFGSMLSGAKVAVENLKTASDVVDFIRDNQVGFSVTQEYEADACALRWLTRLQVPPKEAWSAFASVLQNPGPDADASYVSVHPSPDERTRNIAAVLNKPIDLPPTAAGPGGRRATKPARPVASTK